jgi:RimJ/RimL family protein N-acetyltransferase
VLRAESAADARRRRAITANDEVVGLIGLHTWQHHHRRAELGYDMAISHWGLGISSEAARAVIDYGFTTMKLHRIQAHDRRQPPVGTTAGATRFPPRGHAA